jgi:hypothetical protein
MTGTRSDSSEKRKCDSMVVTWYIWSLFRTRRFNVREHDPTEYSHPSQNVGHENSKLRLEPGGQVQLLTFHKGTIDRLVSFKTIAYLQSSLLLAPQASLHTPREEQMERARSYQATLEVMYVQDHLHVGRLIHSDPRSYLQSLLSQDY